MSATILSRDPTPPGGTEEGRPALNVLVAYADRTTHERAFRVQDHLTEELGEEFELQFAWWKFDFLRHADMFEAAVEAAVRADLIVFSVHAEEKLPAAVHAWIEAWRGKREPRQSALVALFAGARAVAEQPSASYAFFERLASQAGMQFFPHGFQAPADKPPRSLADTGSERATRITPLLDDILNRTPTISHWGINE